MEDIQCIFCNMDSELIVIEENGYKGRKCPQCGLIWISPRPTLPEVLGLYGQDQAYISAESHISEAFRERLYAKHNLRIIMKFIKGGSMLEIGPGAGCFLDEARREGFEVYGVELNNIQADYIRSELEIPCEEIPIDVSLFDGMKFDIVYHCDVISHFHDPIEEFRKINGKLRKDGLVVFETGNIGDIKEVYYRIIAKFQYPDHLFFFGENNLKELIGKTGFELIRVYRYSILPELLISKILNKIITFIKSRGKINKKCKHNRAGHQFSNMSRFSFKQMLRNAYHYFIYILRYRIGYIVPKKGRPQTVIVIARKKN